MTWNNILWSARRGTSRKNPYHTLSLLYISSPPLLFSCTTTNNNQQQSLLSIHHTTKRYYASTTTAHQWQMAKQPPAIQQRQLATTTKQQQIPPTYGKGRAFSKIVIANRGEIACRIIRTAQKEGVKTVAVYSDADKDALHVTLADEALNIGPPPARESYLCGDKIIKVAKETGAEAIHPGYGFLSENSNFAELCEKEGIVFIGPPASAIRSMGSKSASKDIMIAARVPTIPGYHGEDQDINVLKKEAKAIGYPVLIKAVMGGGGKGMRIVEKEEDLEESVNSSKREAISSFGDSRVLVEKYLRHPRHVEIQVFADTHGNVVHLFERDCSVQRRHQKVIEEAPAPHLPPALREKMGKAAVAAAHAVGYVGAGTVEFILDEDGSFYFMEMNTRLQVEHPITEMITKQDLVSWQLAVAAGGHLPLKQEQLAIHGHAFEARIYAENPAGDFLPGTGKLLHLSTPVPSNDTRIETGVREGDEVSVFYDPMIAKLVVWDKDRNTALARLSRALDRYHVVGIHTNLVFLRRLAAHHAFIDGKVETGFIPAYRDDLIPQPCSAEAEALALATLVVLLQESKQQNTQSSNSCDPYSPWFAPTAARLNHTATRTLHWLDNKKEVAVTVTYPKAGNDEYQVVLPSLGNRVFTARGTLVGDNTVNAHVGSKFYNNARVVGPYGADNEYSVFYGGQEAVITLVHDITGQKDAGAASSGNSLLSPMPGKIIKVFAKAGDDVVKGAPLVIMEAMKMEHTIRAPFDGVVEVVKHATGDIVPEKSVLVVMKPKETKEKS